MITYLAAADEPARGWGGPIALALVVALYVTGTTLHHTWLQRHDDPSPTREADTDTGVNTQVNSVSDTDDTDRDTTGWWGRIVDVGGHRVRLTDRDRPDVDDDQDDDEDEDQGQDEPATIESVIAQMLDRGHQYAEVVRHVQEEFEVSEATAKRRIRDVRASRIAAA
ncbi:hypothetical protein [Micromonospora yangpuensis]|nr:hypothetical protein [Micromonospora yangpuensis]